MGLVASRLCTIHQPRHSTTTINQNIADSATFSISSIPIPPRKTRSSTFPAEEVDWEVTATDLAGVAQEVPVALEVLGQEQEGLGGWMIFGDRSVVLAEDDDERFGWQNKRLRPELSVL